MARVYTCMELLISDSRLPIEGSRKSKIANLKSKMKKRGAKDA
jgi:hypothetical protein